ncbi:MAG: hypothetical protein N3B13_00970 [Deltaproteobacteria bacterium]|nr:hypothetical protein [Deltaproteobacteria bacterium]
MKTTGYYYRIWQCPVVIIPLCINGRGEEMVIIRPVLSERAMTAKAAILSKDIIQELSDRILKFPEISGIAMDITSKPPGTIEWE